MSDRILKFHLSIIEEQTIAVPGFIEHWLSLQIQNGIPTLWAVVGEGPSTKEKIIMLGTGWEFSRSDIGDFLGTVQDGGYVWHYFAGE